MSTATNAVPPIGVDGDERCSFESHAKQQDVPDSEELLEYEGSSRGQRAFDSDRAGDLRRQMRAFTAELCAD